MVKTHPAHPIVAAYSNTFANQHITRPMNNEKIWYYQGHKICKTQPPKLKSSNKENEFQFETVRLPRELCLRKCNDEATKTTEL